MSQNSRRVRKRDRFRQIFTSGETSSSNLQLPVPTTALRLDSVATVITTATQPDPPPLSSVAPTQSPSQKRWNDALQKLSKNEQQVIMRLQPQQAESNFSMDSIVLELRTKQQACTESSYKFEFQGRQLILRDVAEKAINWINKFKEVGDVAVNFDPVHAALPWAGVRFLLQAVVAEQEAMGALLVSVEKITYLLRRCQVYEKIYTSETIQADALNNFQSTLVELYATILRCISFASRMLDRNTAGRGLHALFNSDEGRRLIEKCLELETQVENDAMNCDRAWTRDVDAMSRTLLESLKEPIVRLDQRVAECLEILGNDDRLRILYWICDIPHGKTHDTVSDQRTQDTCNWLLKRPQYKEWQSTSSSTILWLFGLAGTGKTFITSRVIDEMQSVLANRSDEGLAFFYCNRNEAKLQEPINVLRSFLRQLSTSQAHESYMRKDIRNFYVERRGKGSEPTIKDCKTRILEALNLYPRTILILDAFDECDKYKRRELLEAFDYFIENAKMPVKIFISSRPDKDLHERFKGKANIRINASDNQQDITKFVESEIKKHLRWGKLKPELKEEIVETVQARSKGMFQWAYLQIKQLLDLQQAEEIKTRLGKLPSGLKSAYDEIFESMTTKEKRVSERAFKWIMSSFVPLSTPALLLAVCQDGDDDRIRPVEDDLEEEVLLNYFHNLLVIDPERNVWVPSHLSVIEYVEENQWCHNKANSHVTTVCLLLLNDPAYYNSQMHMTGLGNLDKDIGCDLNNYARVCGLSHIQRLQKEPQEKEQQRIVALLEQFLGFPTNSSIAYRSWYSVLSNNGIVRYFRPIREMSKVDDLEPPSTAHSAICLYGLEFISPNWWTSPGTELSQLGKTKKSLLQLAAWAGSSQLVSLLLEKGASVEALKSETGSPLIAAAYKGHRDTVNLLIKFKADVNAQAQTGGYSNALIAVAYSGNLEIIQLLLDSGADINTQLAVGEYGSALAAAAIDNYKNSLEVIQLLLDSGADINAQLIVGEYGSALAAAAAWSDSLEIVQLLLDSGADINAQLIVGEYGSALAAAAIDNYKNSLEVIQLLLDSDADINAQLIVGKYGSALAAAACSGNLEIIQLLLDSGADINTQLIVGEYGSALAAAAAWSDSLEIVQLLLDSGADINAQLIVGEYGSALAAAAAWSDSLEIVQLLLDSGADINAQLAVGEYGSALAAAAYYGSLEIVQLLLDSGADINTQLAVGEYGSALAAAAYCGSLEIVQLFIKLGVDPNARLMFGQYESALIAAKAGENVAASNFWMDQGSCKKTVQLLSECVSGTESCEIITSGYDTEVQKNRLDINTL